MTHYRVHVGGLVSDPCGVFAKNVESIVSRAGARDARADGEHSVVEFALADEGGLERVTPALRAAGYSSRLHAPGLDQRSGVPKVR